MSFSVQLHSDISYSSTSINSITYLFNFSQVFIEDGPYKLTWTFRGSPGVAEAYFPNVLLDIGSVNGSFYVAGSTNNATTKTQLIGTLNVLRYMTSATNFYYNCNLNDNAPVIYNNINKSSNYIKVHLTQPGTNIPITSANMGPYVLNLYFEKI
jgi:hypothetical protein